MVGYEHDQSDLKNKNIPMRLTFSFCTQTCPLHFNFTGVRRAIKNDRLWLTLLVLSHVDALNHAGAAVVPAFQAHRHTSGTQEGLQIQIKTFFIVQVEEDTPGGIFSLLSISPQSVNS